MGGSVVQASKEQQGVALILTLILIMLLMVFVAISVQTIRTHHSSVQMSRVVFSTHEIAESALGQAIARIRHGGLRTPHSGSGDTPAWVSFGGGEFHYSSTFDFDTKTSTIRAWARTALDPDPQASSVAPDAEGWDGRGWLVRGIEAYVQGSKYIPETPLYFGNGGIERPLGGFAWTGATELDAPDTWAVVDAGAVSSFQAATIPFEASALNHPTDYLVEGGQREPDRAKARPHEYSVWSTQNPIGQRNIEAWFHNSAGSGRDPLSSVTPDVELYYQTDDRNDEGYPFPVDPEVPDVQSFAWDLWSDYQDDSSAVKLDAGPHAGTFGELGAPRVTFVTGELHVPAGETFEGTGILVIRDDFDPNSNTNNRPSNRAVLNVEGTLRWTGLVVVSGWAPLVHAAEGSDTTIVGALFGEDSVQSGGEISLDSATIILRVEDHFRVLFSRDLFERGGPIYDFLPEVEKTVIGVRQIGVPRI